MYVHNYLYLCIHISHTYVQYIHTYTYIQIVHGGDKMSMCLCPGSVHDARILRESAVYQDFERIPRPLTGMKLSSGEKMFSRYFFHNNRF